LKSNSIQSELKNLGPSQNVSLQVIDPITNEILSQHIGHNAATNALLTGIAHYLEGDGILNQGSANLGMYIPRFISLGTMGLVNQLQDADGLPMGIGHKSYREFCTETHTWVYDRYNDLTQEQRDFLGVFNSDQSLSEEQEEALRFRDYMNMMPGYGADGYDLNMNNSRTSLSDGFLMAGLGPPFNRRGEVGAPVIGTLPQPIIEPCSICGQESCCLHSQTDGKVNTFDPFDYDTVRCELISSSFPRQHISYRNIVPENEAELPRTVDIIFSAMVSTGALSQFRRKGQDFIFITEAGLWARPDWNDSGNNGLLAGYRIANPDKDRWTIYPDYSLYMDRFYKDRKITGIPTANERFQAVQYAQSMISESDFEQARKNRDMLKRSIIKVGVNQVVQVIWKIQLGSIEQLFPGAYCPDCQRQYIPNSGEKEPQPIGNVCAFCCQLDAGNIDLVDEEFCPFLCDIDAGDLDAVWHHEETVESTQFSGALAHESVSSVIEEEVE
jgi:hypothetical protein